MPGGSSLPPALVVGRGLGEALERDDALVALDAHDLHALGVATRLADLDDAVRMRLAACR